MARCRRNVDNFLEACRKIGVDEVSGFKIYIHTSPDASIKKKKKLTTCRPTHKSQTISDIFLMTNVSIKRYRTLITMSCPRIFSHYLTSLSTY